MKLCFANKPYGLLTFNLRPDMAQRTSQGIAERHRGAPDGARSPGHRPLPSPFPGVKGPLRPPAAALDPGSLRVPGVDFGGRVMLTPPPRQRAMQRSPLTRIAACSDDPGTPRTDGPDCDAAAADPGKAHRAVLLFPESSRLRVSVSRPSEPCDAGPSCTHLVTGPNLAVDLPQNPPEVGTLNVVQCDPADVVSLQHLQHPVEIRQEGVGNQHIGMVPVHDSSPIRAPYWRYRVARDTPSAKAMADRSSPHRRA